jgi:hypothetical protein
VVVIAGAIRPALGAVLVVVNGPVRAVARCRQVAMTR